MWNRLHRLSAAFTPRRRAGWLLIAAAGALIVNAPSVHARTAQAKIARISTGVATLEQVKVRLHWPATAIQGDLQVSAARVDVPELGYHWRGVVWQCPLRRDRQGDWRCHGTVRSQGGPALRLALDLGDDGTDVVLRDDSVRLALRRRTAMPDISSIDLTQVPAVWVQALVARVWSQGRLTGGLIDAQLRLATPQQGPLQVSGQIGVAGLALETADAGVAGENLGGHFKIDIRTDIRADNRASPARTSVSVDGVLRGGELLAGNTFIALPPTAVGVQVSAQRQQGHGWTVPTIAWRDDGVLSADGSATLDQDARLRTLDLDLRSAQMGPLLKRYLSGQLALVGLDAVSLRGSGDLRMRWRDGALAAFDAQLREVELLDPDARFGFSGLEGDLRYTTTGTVASALAWRGGTVYGVEYGPVSLPVVSRDGRLMLRAPVTVPLLDGRLLVENAQIQPPRDGVGLQMEFGLALEQIDFARVSQVFGLPPFRGRLGGSIPRGYYANERMVFDGGLSANMFGGEVRFSSLALERPFGAAPSLTADIALQDLDLQQLTGVLDVGSISGRLDGTINGLRLVDWTPVAFDARLRTNPVAARRHGQKQRISQRAVQDISSVGDASFVSSVQGQLIGLFDDFGYRQIGIACRLVNEVCSLSGTEGSDSQSAAFTIVQGAGLPRLEVVGHNREVDWPTLVERIIAAGKGEVSPVVE